jgi:hypothetical protein
MTQHFRHKMLFMTNFVLNMTLYFCHTKPFFCSEAPGHLNGDETRRGLRSTAAELLRCGGRAGERGPREIEGEGANRGCPGLLAMRRSSPRQQTR